MSLKEIMEAEEGVIIDIGQIKLKCFEFAIDVTKSGIYTPEEVMDEAKKIFDWVIDVTGFENQT